MKWGYMNKIEAESKIRKYEEKTESEFESLKKKWEEGDFFVEAEAEEYKDLRKEIVQIFNENKGKGNYIVDLEVGLKLYELLSNGKYKISISVADDDQIWIYMTVKVFLDITYLRSPKPDSDGKYFSHQRIYSWSKRIWLKQLWWFVHLAWQGDVDSTREVLKYYGSGQISQILERSGLGYRTDVTRVLLKRIPERLGLTKSSQADFRSLMMLYYAKTYMVEPTLVVGGVECFVDDLIEEKYKKEEE